MDLKICSSAESNQTLIVYTGDNLNDALVSFATPNIILQQEPTESLDLQFSSNYHCDVDANHHLNKCILNLTFHNNLHELAKNYDYEIICKSLSYNNDCHQLLFAHRVTRISETINIERLFVAKNSNLIHLCFCIHRYKSGDIPNYQDNNVGFLLWKMNFYSDITLLVGDKSFKAHKYILSSRSEVFKAMFTHDMSESQNGLVKIEDCDAEVVEEMLTFIYNGSTKNIAKISRELFEAAHKYQIHELRRRCEEFFLFSMHHENVVVILDIANLYELKDLKEHAMTFIASHQQEMAREESFQDFLCRDLKVDTVTDILILCAKYNMENVKLKAFEFVKEYSSELAKDENFLLLFNLHPDLMREIYVFIHSVQ